MSSRSDGEYLDLWEDWLQQASAFGPGVTNQQALDRVAMLGVDLLDLVGASELSADD